MQFKPVYFRMEQENTREKKIKQTSLKENSKYSKSTLTLKQIASDGSCPELESAKQKLYKKEVFGLAYQDLPCLLTYPCTQKINKYLLCQIKRRTNKKVHVLPLTNNKNCAKKDTYMD